MQFFTDPVDAVSIGSAGGARKSSDVTEAIAVASDINLVGGARKSSTAATTLIPLTCLLRYLPGSADTALLARRQVVTAKLAKIALRTADIFCPFVNCII